MSFSPFASLLLLLPSHLSSAGSLCGLHFNDCASPPDAAAPLLSDFPRRSLRAAGARPSSSGKQRRQQEQEQLPSSLPPSLPPSLSLSLCQKINPRQQPKPTLREVTDPDSSLCNKNLGAVWKISATPDLHGKSRDLDKSSFFFFLFCCSDDFPLSQPPLLCTNTRTVGVRLYSHQRQ